MTGTGERPAGAPDVGLARRSLAAIAWNYTGNAARAGSQFVVAIVLARLLGPASFGVAAVGWLAFGVGALLGDLGFNAAIIQRHEITKRDADFAFTIQLAASTAIMLAIWAGAPWLARFFDQPEATGVVRAMAASLVIRALGQTATALLQRDLRFRATQAIGVASYTLGFGGVGIALAWLGFGAWSLVGAQLAQVTMNSVAMLAVARRRLAFAARPDHPDITRTGLLVIAANAGSWAIGNVDTVIVGHVCGPVTLGLYNRATALATMPSAMIVGGLQSVLLSAASRAQHDAAKLRAAFFGSVALFVLLAGPVLATMALVAGTVVTALLGPAWQAAAALLAPLAMAMAVHGMLSFAGPVLTATGNVRKEAQAQALVLPVMIVATLLAARHSAPAAAWAVLGSYALRLVLLTARVKESLAFTWPEAWRALLPSACVAAVTAGMTALTDAALAGIAAPARLLADVGVAALTLGGAMLLLHRPLLRGPLGRVLRAPGIVPRRLRGLLAA